MSIVIVSGSLKKKIAKEFSMTLMILFIAHVRGSSQLIMDIFNNLSTVSGILKIIACF